MRFHVEGVDAQTGAEKSKIISAESEDGALQVAKSLGILPTSVRHPTIGASEKRSEATFTTSEPKQTGLSEGHYKCVQVSPTISASKDSGREAARYIESLINQMWNDGWEFYRIDTVGVSVAPGCLASLFGSPMVSAQYYVITFRRID